MTLLHCMVQAQEPPARPQGLEDLLHMLAAQQVTSQTEGETGSDDTEAYTQSKCQ